MFTESDRVNIRRYLGFGALWLQADSRLESAISAVQAVTDPGGTRPDNSTETMVKAVVVDLQTVDSSLKQLWVQMQALGVDSSIKVDPVRAMAALRSEGRRLVHVLARVFDTEPRADIFAAGSLATEGYPMAAAGGHTAY